MNKLIQLFEEYILKAIEQTENALNLDFNDNQKLDLFIENRHRLLMIIDQISRQINWPSVPEEKRLELDKQIGFIKKLDEKLIVKLQEHKAEVKTEIEKLGFNANVIDLGEVELEANIDAKQKNQIKIALENFGFELIDDKKSKIIEKIKHSLN